ncbi:hypothetical protein [Runella aurantiaca]|nr:hypothetical protein [Runella aurantiaca]
MMIKKLLFLLLGACFSISAIAQTTAEEEGIKTLLLQETKNAYAVDVQEYNKNWVKAPHTYRAWNSRTGYDVKQGWDAIEKERLAAFKVAKAREINPILENMVFKFYSNEACFVTYDQYLYGKESKPTKEVRVLEKHDNAWKIAAVVALTDYSQNKFEEGLVRKSIDAEQSAALISDYEVHIAGITAWATFFDTANTEAKVRQVRILERSNGAWKIVFAGIQTLEKK